MPAETSAAPAGSVPAGRRRYVDKLRPPEVLVEGKTFRLVRARETCHDLVQLEHA